MTIIETSRVLANHGVGGECIGLVVCTSARYSDSINQLLQDMAGSDFPTPAVSVDPIDGVVLWLALGSAVSDEQLDEIANAIQDQYFRGISEESCQIQAIGQYLRGLSLREAEDGKWSAFIDPSLISMFENETWLDFPPSREQQSLLLSRVKLLDYFDIRQFLVQKASRDICLPSNTSEARWRGAGTPFEFLVDVMNDESQSMSNRVAAAAALLPHWPTS